jgi:hypothetical protein
VPEDRRYRQQGYKDSAANRQPPRQESRPPAMRPGPVGGMLAKRAVSRCGECGTLLPAPVDPRGRCPKCGLALHACKQCAHFDPGRRFECAQPIPERIADKNAPNDCSFYSLRVMVERDTSSGSVSRSAPAPVPVRPEEARRAFDNLFKK